MRTQTEWMPVRYFKKGTYDRYYRRKMMNRRGKWRRRAVARNFQNRVRKAVLKTAETKYFDVAVENNQLFHNLGYGTLAAPPVNVTSIPDFFNPWLKITEGTQRFNRIGDKITPRGMSLKLYLAAKNDRPNVMVRLIVAILPKLIGTTITTNSFDPFQIANSGINGNNMLWPADRDAGVKFLYDKIIRISANQAVGRNYPEYGATAREGTKIVKLWIKRKRANKIVFNTPDNTIVNKPLAIYAIPYEQYSTLTTDNVASIAGVMRMYYKDV